MRKESDEIRKERCRKAAITHGMSKTNFYAVWKSIKQRCTNQKTSSFKDYGGRGIKLCKKWLKFKNFKEDMYESYLDHKRNYSSTTIERINNDSDYSKDNCKWAVWSEQFSNRRIPRGYVWKKRKSSILFIGLIYI
jgi:hypothetical protein